MLCRVVCVGLAVVVALATVVSAATHHVNPNHPAAGDDNTGAADKPWKTLGRAAQAVEPGDTVLVHSGVYREKVVIDKSGSADKPIRFEAAVGASVIVTGADRLTDWRREQFDTAVGPSPAAASSPRPQVAQGNLFSTPWPHRFITHSKQFTHPDDAYHLLIGRAEQVFVLGYPLRQVLSKDKLTRGTFFVDLEAKRLYVWSSGDSDLGKVPVEASVRDVVWDVRGDHVQTRGLRFRYAANRAQQGAASFSGHHQVVEDCVFERTNSIGAVFRGQDIVVRRCTFQDNGQMGFSANRAHRLLLTGSVVRNNNVKGFSRGWEAGGDKLCFCRGVVLENSQFVENRGNGIWFDIGNEQCVVRNCLIADNEDAGIFYEISFGLHAHDNVIVGNGFAGTPGSWGAAAGISLSSSPDCVVERNLIVGNKEGFNYREQIRTTPRIDDKASVAVWNHDQVVRQNVIAYNRDAQTWGWFDIADERHWPRAMQERKAETRTAAEDVARGYQARDARGQPAGSSLEALKLRHEKNVFACHPGQGLFHWGVTWKRNKRYDALDDARRELGLEDGSVVAEPRFADPWQRDFRVPKDSAVLKLGCYPRGQVPGVTLGESE